MTKEEAIEILKDIKHGNYLGGIIDNPSEEATAFDMAIKALEQQPSDDKVTITIDKGTLKYSGQGYVVYNKDWFKKHFAMEVEIMTGYDGYKEQPTSDDCVSRAEVLKGSVEVRRLDGVEVYSDKVVPIEYVKALPPVTPTYHKSATNGEEIIRAFPNLKYTIQNGRVVTTIGVASSFDLDWWNAPYKRGSENDTKTSHKGI